MAALKYTGKIKKAFEKGGRFSFLMDDDEWYGLGRKKPQYKDGSDVTDGDDAQFDYEINSSGGRNYRNIVEGTLRLKKGVLPDSMKPTPKNKGGGGGGFQADKAAREKYWADKEARDKETQKIIGFHGSLNTATEIVKIAVDAEMVKVGGKAADKLGTLYAVINELAGDIFRQLQSVPENYEDIMGAEEQAKPSKIPEDLEAPEEETPDTVKEADDDDGWD